MFFTLGFFKLGFKFVRKRAKMTRSMRGKETELRLIMNSWPKGKMMAIKNRIIVVGDAIVLPELKTNGGSLIKL